MSLVSSAMGRQKGNVEINLVGGQADVRLLADEAQGSTAFIDRCDLPPEPGFARREAHCDRNHRSERRAGGS
jgi:hypothetical protein